LKLGTLGAVDTKNHSDHVLPMGRYVWELMRRRRRAADSAWVFANPLTGSRITDPHRQVVNVVAKSGVPFSPHALRRTFASIVSRLGDRLSYYTTKRLLNHRTGDVTQGYVQFDLEQLRSAMQAVEDFVLQKVKEGPSHGARVLDTSDMRADNSDSPATPTSQLPATRRRLYGNLPLSEERDPFSVPLVTG
jgi:hypothetical protein